MKKEEKDFNFQDLFVPLTTKRAIIFIAIIGILVYFNSLFNGFVWDDHVLNNLNYHPLDFSSYFGINTFNNAGYYYRPFALLYYQLIYYLTNNFTFFYHFFQLLLHFSNCVLILLFFKKFISQKIAFLMSVIFLIHPINVESVVYIAAALGPLSFFFGMISLIFCTKKSLSRKDFAIIFLMTCLSLFTKETGTIFIFLSLIFRWLFKYQKLIQLAILQIIAFLIYIVLRVSVIGISFSSNSGVSVIHASTLIKILTIPAVLKYYLQTFVFPSKLLVSQLWIVNKITVADFIFPLFIDFLFFLTMGLIGRYVHKKNKEQFKLFIFWVYWVMLGFILLLPIFPLYMTVADRYFYFPIVGLLGIIGQLIQIQSKKISFKTKKVFLIGILTVLTLLVIRTIIRNSDWYSDLTLFSHDAKGEFNYVVEDNLAVALEKKGDYKNALKHAQNAIKLLPNDVNFHDLASIYESMGDKQNAAKYYIISSKAKNYTNNYKHYELIDEKLGRGLILYADSKYAESFLNTSLKDYPDFPILQAEYAIALYKNKNKEKAVSILQSEYKKTTNKVIFSLYNEINSNKSLGQVLLFLNP